MKQIEDNKTIELKLPLKRGRPKSATAKSNAERQAAYRARHLPMDLGPSIPNTIRALTKQFDISEAEVTKSLLRFALRNRNWKQIGFTNT